MNPTKSKLIETIIKKFGLNDDTSNLKLEDFTAIFMKNMATFYNEASTVVRDLETKKVIAYRAKIKSTYNSNDFKKIFDDFFLSDAGLTRKIESLQVDQRTINKILKKQPLFGRSLDFFSVFLGYKGWQSFITNFPNTDIVIKDELFPFIVKNNPHYNNDNSLNDKNSLESDHSISNFFINEKHENTNWKLIIKNIKHSIFSYKKIEQLGGLSYDSRFEKFTFLELIENINLLENQIIEDLYIFSLQFLRNSGFDAIGNLFLYNNERYKFSLIHNENTRTLEISLFHISNPNIENTQSNIEINQIGLIKNVDIIYPKHFGKQVEDYLIQLKKIFSYAYLSLEKKFISSFKNIKEQLFDNLYNILNVEIECQNKEHLLGQAIFVITSRDKVKFRYFFDLDYLQKLISYFKKNQVKEFSPLELLISLLVEEAIHTINLLMNIQIGEVVFLESSNFKSAEDDYRFWIAESHLLNYKDISTYTLFMNEDLIFQISFKRIHEKEFIEIVNVCNKLLKEQFVNNIENYYIYANKLNKIRNLKLSAKSSKIIADFLNILINQGS